MRRIIANARVSLDGVMQAPNGPQEDTSDGFDLGGLTMLLPQPSSPVNGEATPRVSPV
jgi:hypothetical protein